MRPFTRAILAVTVLFTAFVPSSTTSASGGPPAIAAGGFHTCYVTSGGGVLCWGNNDFGEVGDGTTTHRSIPVPVFGLSSGIQAVATPGYVGDFTCALTTGGGVKCWGDNGIGELGTGTGVSSVTPVDVSGLSSGVVEISAGGGGGGHACALTSGGGVKCWGYNASGELGDGTTTNRFAPVAVSGLSSGVAAIAAGGTHTCALTTGGGVKCWGRNVWGTLGNGTTTNSTIPVDVSGLSSGVQSISGGSDHTCAVLNTGALKCWGYNGLGQLGDGTTTTRLTPASVSGLASGVEAVSAGLNHSCALVSGGGVKCWGDNAFSQVGDGTTTGRLTPVTASGLATGVAGVSAGGLHTCAAMDDGTARCWGYNGYGELGDGTTTIRSTPTAVSGIAPLVLDDDGDGVPNAEDVFPLDPAESVDTDGDGTGNNADLDDDGDGQSDLDEVACGSNPLNAASLAADADSDYLPNCVDADDDSDGVLDSGDAFPQDASRSVATIAFSAASGSPFSVGSQPWDVAAGDVNGDGLPDLATANQASNSVSVLLGNGSGGFTPAPGSPVLTAAGPRSVIMADLTGDGLLDLVTANYTSNSVTVLLGDGAGGFAQAAGSPVSAGSSPYGVTSADFNGDGRPDLAVTNYYANNVKILLGDGSGGFTPAAAVPVGASSGSYDVVAADFNGDGDADLAVANVESGWVSILLGNGLGGFTLEADSPGVGNNRAATIIADDFNADGRVDLATANPVGDTVTLFLGDGAGGFSQAAGSPFAAGDAPYGLAAADFNSDGILDLAAANYSANSVSMLIGNGVGGFTTVGPPLPTGLGPNAVVAVDVDLDGRPDLATANLGAGTVSVLLNTFSPDTDGDGVADDADAFPLDAAESVDTDGDGTGDNADLDDDGDGQGDAGEAACGSNPLDATSLSADFDSDYSPDCVDSDDDNDGVADGSDAFPLNAAETTDTDGDGTGNNADTDDDNDSVVDATDAFPLNATESVDTDGDGIGNNADTNDDNDGLPDASDPFPLDPLNIHPIYLVNSTADAVDAAPGNGVCATATGVCTLRAAVQETNALAGSDTIQFTGTTITLTISGSEDAAAGGDLDVQGALTIVGNGAGLTIVQGCDADATPACVGIDRIFDVQDGATLTLTAVTVRNGAGGIRVGVHLPWEGGYGGRAGLVLTDAEVLNNTGAPGVTSIGDVTITRSRLAGNRVPAGYGGAMQAGLGTTLQMVDSVVHDNSAIVGGAIFTNSGGAVTSFTISGSTFSGNATTYDGGAISVNGGGPYRIANTTFSGNTVSGTDPGIGGGAIFADAPVQLASVTFSGNGSGTIGAAIHARANIAVRNTIVGGAGSANCAITGGGSVTSLGYNLSSDTSCGFAGTGDLSGVDPALAPLADNGGPTRTHALLGTSPAIDAGNPAGCTDTTEAALATDQRGAGFPRALDGDGDGTARCDIGAVEGIGITADTDGDGVLDVDDAVPLDAGESVDTDNDGTGNNADTDDDGDGAADAVDVFPLDAAESVDTDSDGTGNNADTDDDNDGTPDATDAFPLDAAESVDTDSDGAGNDADADDDNDGVPDATDAFPLNAAESVDTDSDGTGNNADTDDDNDGTPDATDAFPSNAAESVDTDSDGTGNNADADDDNDAVPDAMDAFPLNAAESVDTDSDGTGDNADTDDDNDGTPDATDAFPSNAAESVDTDSDGTGNNADTDDDNDGTPDATDAFPLDAAESVDTDSDGTGNNADADDDNDGAADATDAFPLNAAESVDTDGDSTGNNADLDDDGDTVPDTTDAFPLNAAESVDTDGDSTGNNADTDDDNDGTADATDAFPLNAAESVDTDSDGTGNNADADDDGDGIADGLDRNRVTGVDESTTVSSDYFKNAATFGTITRNGWTVTLVDLGGRVQATLSGAGAFPASITACAGTAKQVRLDVAGERASWSCTAAGTVSVRALAAAPVIEVAKLVCYDGCFFQTVASLRTNRSYSTGSPSFTDADSDGPVDVAILDNAGILIGGYTLEPGEGLDIEVVLGLGGQPQVEIAVLSGSVPVTVYGQTLTLTPDNGETVFARDVAPPAIAAAGDVVAEATSPGGAVVTFGLPAVTDDVDPAPVVTASPASGSVFPLGPTPVTVTATDAAGHSATATFTVTVVDTTPPTIAAPADQVLEATSAAGATATFAATATDTASTPVITYSHSPGSMFSLGTTTVTATATDGSGNTASTTFVVTVRDTTRPTLAVPADLTVTCSQLTADGRGCAKATDPTVAAWLASASASDTVDGTPTITHDAPAVLAIGVTTVTFRAVDDAGNSAQRTARVQVVYDFGGFLPPLVKNAVASIQQGRQGRTIPVKFQLRCGNGAAVSTAIASIAVFKILDAATGTVDTTDLTADAGGANNNGNLFRYDATSQQYLYNLSTAGWSAPATYRIVVSLDDGTQQMVDFSLR